MDWTKLMAAFSKLRRDLREIEVKVDRFKIHPIPEKGEPGPPGKSPSIETVVSAVLDQIPTPKDGVSPDPKAIVADVLAVMPKPAPGRDAPPVNVSDVAAIVLAKIPKPKDGKDGPKLEAVVSRVRALVKDGAPGKPGPPGKPGKDGVSVTDVSLEDNDLFVALDGERKKVGSIKLPVIKTPFSPGNAGGGGSNRQLEPVVRINNRVIVNKQGDWPVVIGGAVPLKPFTEYHLGSDDVGIPEAFSVTGPTVINGAPGVSRMVYEGTDPLIKARDFGRLVIQDLNIDCPNAELLDAEDIDSPSTSLLSFVNVIVERSAGAGTFKNILGLTINLFNFLNTGKGFRDLGTNTPVLSVQRYASTSTSATYVAFDFGVNVYSSIEFSNIRTSAPAGAVAFKGLPNNGNVAPQQLASITSCEFLGGVVPLEGITPDDFRYRFNGNGAAIADTNPDALISLVGNALPTPVLGGTPTKVVGVWGEERLSHFSFDDSGRATYVAEVPVALPIDIALDLEPETGTNKDLFVYVAINGDAKIASGREVRVDAGDPKSVTAIWQHQFNTGDYVEAFVANKTDDVALIAAGGISRTR